VEPAATVLATPEDRVVVRIAGVAEVPRLLADHAPAVSRAVVDRAAAEATLAATATMAAAVVATTAVAAAALAAAAVALVAAVALALAATLAAAAVALVAAVALALAATLVAATALMTATAATATAVAHATLGALGHVAVLGHVARLHVVHVDLAKVVRGGVALDLATKDAGVFLRAQTVDVRLVEQGGAVSRERAASENEYRDQRGKQSLDHL